MNRVEFESLMAAVERAAGPDRMGDLLRAICLCAKARPTFIGEDIWMYVPGSEVFVDRALGPAMRRAASLGLIEKTGAYRPAATSHGSAKPVWHSLIFGPIWHERVDQVDPAR